MTTSRRELRLLKQQTDPPEDTDIHLHPEVLRAVAKKMRERNPEPHDQMPSKIYILYKVMHEFIEGLEAVANDEEPAIRFLQQREANGQEGSDGLH